MQIPTGLEDQIANCFKTINAVLDEAGFSLADVVRVTYIVADRSLIPQAMACVGSYFRDVRPAATMMLAGLIEEAMKIEIELTALHQSWLVPARPCGPEQAGNVSPSRGQRQ